MSKEDNWETNYRKTLTASGFGVLITSLFAGPAAPLVAAAGMGMILGRAARGLFNKEAQKEYEEENLKEEKGSKYKKAIQENNSYVPESPGTAIARRNPSLSKGLLEEMSKNEMYKRISEESVAISKDYLEQMKKINPEKLARSNGMSVSVEEDLNWGLERLLFGKKSNGYKINISLKENDIK